MEGYLVSGILLLVLLVWVAWCIFGSQKENFGQATGAASSTRWDLQKLTPNLTKPLEECNYSPRTLTEGTKFQRDLPTFSYTPVLNNCQRECELVADQLYDLSFGKIACSYICSDKVDGMVQMSRTEPGQNFVLAETQNPNSPFYNPPTVHQECHNYCKKWLGDHKIGEAIPQRLEEKYIMCMQDCDSSRSIERQCKAKCAFDNSNCENCTADCVRMNSVNAIGGGYTLNY